VEITSIPLLSAIGIYGGANKNEAAGGLQSKDIWYRRYGVFLAVV